MRDAAGNFYGTTIFGGKGCKYLTKGCGTAFKLDKTGKQVWVHFFNGSGGRIPYGGLLLEKGRESLRNHLSRRRHAVLHLWLWDRFQAGYEG